MSRGTPGGASIGTATPGSVADDDKGRGSYKCGKCGVPKKGHICPYQPKVKRKSDEPPPEMKCVSTQVEMDEFMTLRRLNIEIQGFPESYAAEPADNCGVEVHGHPHHPLPPHAAGLPPPGTPHHAYPQTSSSAGRPPPPGSIIRQQPGMTPNPHGHPPPPHAMSMPQGPPTALPSLLSMSSQPHPSATSTTTATAPPEQINSSDGTKTEDVMESTDTAMTNGIEKEEPSKTEATTSPPPAEEGKDETEVETTITKVEEKGEQEEKSPVEEAKDDNNSDEKDVETTSEKQDDTIAPESVDDNDKKRGVEEEEGDSTAKKQKV